MPRNFGGDFQFPTTGEIDVWLFSSYKPITMERGKWLATDRGIVYQPTGTGKTLILYPWSSISRVEQMRSG